MKFSLIYEAQTADPTREGDHRVFAETMEQVLLAEELGFDTIWAVEHTALTMYAHMSAPETFLAWVAGATTRIGIGHGVICLPPAMNHPVKVAERCATLDIVSGGRLHVGFGKGGTEQEAGTFGYAKAELPPMIDEAMRLIPRYWVEDEVAHEGEFLSIPARSIHPKPLQDPHPPLYQACTRTETLADAGGRGIGALVLGFGGPDEIAEKNAVYRAAFRDRDPAKQVGCRPNEHLAALCPTVVLDDGDEARRLGVRGQRFFMESIGHWASDGAAPLPDPASWGDGAGDGTVEAAIGGESVELDLSDAAKTLRNTDHGYGTTDECTGYVERLIAAGADEILFLCQMGTIPQDVQLATLRALGDVVIPRFRRR
ncbi:MAG: LLM class flavin-dependent oxidoreductase [Actinomycetota bacterium]